MQNINFTVFQYRKINIVHLFLLFYHFQVDAADSAFHAYLFGCVVAEDFFPAQAGILAAVQIDFSDSAAHGIIVIALFTLYIDILQIPISPRVRFICYF